jgi:hypothetical protein
MFIRGKPAFPILVPSYAWPRKKFLREKAGKGGKSREEAGNRAIYPEKAGPFSHDLPTFSHINPASGQPFAIYARQQPTTRRPAHRRMGGTLSTAPLTFPRSAAFMPLQCNAHIPPSCLRLVKDRSIADFISDHGCPSAISALFDSCLLHFLASLFTFSLSILSFHHNPHRKV